jgi:tetratricopeptide (TPR) repeat protein
MEHLILGTYSTRKQATLGTGKTKQEQQQSIMWLAAQMPSGDICVQPLDAANAPTGIVAIVKSSDFFQSYIPEPECYDRYIRSGLRGLLDWMGPSGNPLPREQPEKPLDLFLRGFLAILHGERGMAVRPEDHDKLRQIIAQAKDMHFYDQFRVGISSAAVTQRKEKNYPLAINFYCKALEVKEDDHLLFNTARTYYEMKNIDAAKECLRKALAINPGLDVAKRFLDFIDAPAHNAR